MNDQPRSTRSVDLPVHPAEVPLARRAVLDVLVDWGVPDDSDAVHAIRLIVSELLTNVVLHASAATARARVVVELLDGAWIRMGVHDGDPCLPGPADSCAEATSGRGLQIVHALIDELNGVVVTERTADGGKTVWVELPCTVGEQATEALAEQAAEAVG
jgi:two-component sensor histidine kinase